MKKGHLYLIPVPLGEATLEHSLPTKNLLIMQGIRVFIVEEIRSARRFLKRSGYTGSIDAATFYELNEHTKSEELGGYLNAALQGENIGLVSEAGLPCIADPGNLIVCLAHKLGIRVIPLVGPSSIMLALMSSGLNGQQFVFHGYLPVKNHDRASAIRNIEKDMLRSGKSQIFIETPYRNISLLESILKTCHPETLLCIATDLSQETESISTQQVKHWKNRLPAIAKRPTVFILGRESQ